MTGYESVKGWEQIKACSTGDECFYAKDELAENVRSFYTLHLIGSHRTVNVYIHAIAFSVELDGNQVDQVSKEDNSRESIDKWHREHIMS